MKANNIKSTKMILKLSAKLAHITKKYRELKKLKSKSRTAVNAALIKNKEVKKGSYEILKEINDLSIYDVMNIIKHKCREFTCCKIGHDLFWKKDINGYVNPDISIFVEILGDSFDKINEDTLYFVKTREIDVSSLGCFASLNGCFAVGVNYYTKLPQYKVYNKEMLLREYRAFKGFDFEKHFRSTKYKHKKIYNMNAYLGDYVDIYKNKNLMDTIIKFKKLEDKTYEIYY